MNEVYKCPVCEAEFTRNPHYLKIRDMVAAGLFTLEDTTVEDFCGNCHHVEFKEETK